LRELISQAEARKDVKAENARLRAELQKMRSRGDDAAGEADTSIEEIPATSFEELAKRRATPADESLLVDSEVHLSSSPGPDQHRHPTARTFAYDLSSPRRAKRKGDRHVSRHKASSSTIANKENTVPSVDSDEDLTELVDLFEGDIAHSPLKRKVNPFQSTKHASDKRRILPSHSKPSEVVDLTGDDKTRRSALSTKTLSGNSLLLASPAGRGVREGSGSATAEKLLLVDGHGNMRKGLVAGIKSKRRA
jgi:hypothetical protein